MMNKISKILLTILFLSAFIFLHGVKADDDQSGYTFNPNYIISDDEIMDTSSMDLNDIQKFLESKGSYLANYSCADASGVTRKASEIIYNASANNYDCGEAVDLSDNPTDAEKNVKCRKISINPKFLLVLLQKEQSLVEDQTPRQSQLDWAAGYGCPDSAACGTRWKGFGKQVNSAALQFYDYMVNPRFYTYKAGGSYLLSNPYSVHQQGSIAVNPINQATAALYNYTPHVYNGNYNFYNIWQRWFTRNYPDGTLIQAKGEPGVWLIQGGKKRPFTSRGALTSRYDLNKVITVNKSDLDKYEKGAEIKFSQYSLVRSPGGTIYLLVDDKRHAIVGKNTFRTLGFNPDEVVSGSWDDLAVYKESVQVTATSTPMGFLAQDKKTGGVFWVEDNIKSPIWDRVFLATKFKHKKISKKTANDLAKFPTGSPVLFNDGELLKSPESPGVFIITNGEKSPFSSGEIFEKLGYKWGNIITVSSKVLNLYPLGNPIREINGAGAPILADSSSGSGTSTTPIASSTPPVTATSSIIKADTSTSSQPVTKLLK